MLIVDGSVIRPVKELKGQIRLVVNTFDWF